MEKKLNAKFGEKMVTVGEMALASEQGKQDMAILYSESRKWKKGPVEQPRMSAAGKTVIRRAK